MTYPIPFVTPLLCECCCVIIIMHVIISCSMGIESHDDDVFFLPLVSGVYHSGHFLHPFIHNHFIMLSIKSVFVTPITLASFSM